MSNILELIKERRSIRRFQPDNVPRELIMEIIEAATWAPSAGNLQPWEFYIVTQEALRKELAVAARQRFVGEAPVIIVVCALPERSAAYYADRGRSLYCIQDTAAAIQNILLAASSLGLATCWVGAFSEEKVAKALRLSPDQRPVALIPLGYPAHQSHPPKRRPPDQVVHWL